jgi:hypothetical protein
MPKYNLKDLKKRSINEPLPEDVNEKAEQAALVLGGKELVERLRFIRDKRWFGVLYHKDKDGTLDSWYEFEKGIIKQFKLVKEYDGNAVFHMNVINSKVSLREKIEQ